MSVRVSTFTTPAGNVAAEQYIITTDDYRYFQSYQTIIARIHRMTGEVTLNTSYNQSKTTGRYRNDFLGEGIAETRRKVEAGVYEVADLNK